MFTLTQPPTKVSSTLNSRAAQAKSHEHMFCLHVIAFGALLLQSVWSVALCSRTVAPPLSLAASTLKIVTLKDSVYRRLKALTSLTPFVQHHKITVLQTKRIFPRALARVPAAVNDQVGMIC